MIYYLSQIRPRIHAFYLYFYTIVDIKKNDQERIQERCQDDIEDEIDRKFSDAWSAPIIPSKPTGDRRSKVENKLSQGASPSFLEACEKLRSTKQKRILELGRPKLIIRSDIFA